jgi:glucose/arabinose dehydrogenase
MKTMLHRSLSLLMVPLLTALSLLLGACSDGGSGDVTTTQPQPPVAVTSGTSFPSSPVRITFSVTNFTIGLPGTPHLRFSIDSGPLHDFYNGAGIDSDNGVLLNGVHTHFVHWTSPNSFDLFALPAGPHQVRLALVDQNNQELPGASTTFNFTVLSPPVGDLLLQSVLGGLNVPVGLSLAPDGRIFYNELRSGKIRIINPSWQLDPTPFCQISISALGEQGLLGLTLDPNFSSNHYVYVYYTTPGATMNRVSRFSKSGGVCTETVILDNLPVSSNHNGGIIKFGPDGKLYVVIGDATIPSNAQDINSLSGKILRVNPDGSAASNNPFILNPNPNAQKVFSFGHRNSYGFTFHPQTNHLWESENGPDDNDEINRVVSGGNYGWPIVGGIVGNPSYRDPILAFNPVIAPTGIIAIPGNSSVYPPVYHNNLLVAVFIDGTIRHVVLSGANLDQFGGTSVAYTGGQGGLLSFMLGSDGYVYVSNSNGIFRVVVSH